MPRWLWLLLFGGAIGAGAVIYVQQRHLPPRLSAAESGRLTSALESAELERSRLAGGLVQANEKTKAALAEQQRAAAEIAANRRELSAQSDSIDALLAALPPDPRGGTIEVRAARFKVDGDTLGYDVVLTRAARTQATPLSGVLQFVFAGTTARGTETTLTLDPIKVDVDRYAIASGSLPMPDGFSPREATIRVLDRAGGKALGMRVIYVK